MLTLEGKLGTYHLTPNQQPKGKFGGILLGERLEDGLRITAKKLPKTVSDDEQALRQTIVALQHPNLAPSIETIGHNNDTYLIRPYIEGSSFKTIFKKHSLHKHLEPSFFIEATIHLLNGLEYLHNNNLVHRDIKPANIILRHDKKCRPKDWRPSDVVLIDFEQACHFPVESPSRSPFALVYSPPEQLLNHNELVCPQSDFFALGVTMYEVLAGSPPWVDCNAEILLNLQLTYPMKRPSGIDERLFPILERAAYKERFNLPPRRLAPEVVESILKKGIEQRYANAVDFRQALVDYKRSMPVPIRKANWLVNWFNRKP